MTDSLWKARLLPASWRGIPFFIDSHELKGGRHAVTHEPPDRNKNNSEDVGRKSKMFTIDAHVLGDNYFFIRDALVDAMEQQGKGTLIHPYLGLKEVQPEGFTVTETTTEGRIARIQMTFVEAGEPSFPFSAIDAVSDFITSAAATVAQIKNVFQVAFKVAELPAYAQESAEVKINDFTDTIQNGFKNVRLNGEEQAKLKRDTDAVSDDSRTLALNPASLIEETDSIISGLKDLVPDEPEASTIDSSSGRDDKLAVFNDLLDFTGVSEDIIETTPTREQERANADAFADAVQQLAIVRLSEQVISKEFKSNDEALEIRDRITAAISEQLDKERTNDETFQALRDLSAKVVKAVPNTASEFQNVKIIEALNATPTLAIAYDLYGNVDNEQDIIDRNKLREPAFALGELKVLS
jgi:prophage DNA circulation protein